MKKKKYSLNSSTIESGLELPDESKLEFLARKTSGGIKKAGKAAKTMGSTAAKAVEKVTDKENGSGWVHPETTLKKVGAHAKNVSDAVKDRTKEQVKTVSDAVADKTKDQFRVIYSGLPKRKKEKSHVEKKKIQIRPGKIIKFIIILILVVNLLPIMLGFFSLLADEFRSIFNHTLKPTEWEKNFDPTDENFQEDDYYSGSQASALYSSGDYFETILPPGNYKAGMHIPEGTYDVELISGDGFCFFKKDDQDDNAKYWQLGFDEDFDEVSYIDGLNFVQGGTFCVNDGAVVRIETESARIDKMAELPENLLTDSVEVYEGYEGTAGADFPAGIYDLCSNGGRLYLEIFKDDTKDMDYIYVDDPGEVQEFRNVWLEEGDYVTVSLGVGELIPSEMFVY